MRYSQLFERVLNLQTSEEKRHYANQVWDILQKSYAGIGGFKSAANVEELIADSGIWKVVKRGDSLSSVFVYKDHLGRKSIASGTDGTDQGKKDFGMVKNADIKMNRAWAEVSGAPEAILKRMKARPVSNTLAGALTGKNILSLDDDGIHYTRLIAGEPHKKVIYGVVDLDQKTLDQLTNAGVDIKNLPDNVRLPK